MSLQKRAEENSGEMLQRLGLDARLWADEFYKLNRRENVAPIAHDIEWLEAWFANAIMAGFDEGQRRGEKAGALAEREKLIESASQFFIEHQGDYVCSALWEQFKSKLAGEGK